MNMCVAIGRAANFINKCVAEEASRTRIIYINILIIKSKWRNIWIRHGLCYGTGTLGAGAKTRLETYTL